MKGYGDIVREKMKSADNAQGHPVTIRMMERSLGYSYEHIRKVVKNEPVVSEDMNRSLCEYLGIDSARMWSIAEKEKQQRRIKRSKVLYMPPPDPYFKQAWSELTPADIDRLRVIVEGMAEANRSGGYLTGRRRSK